MTVPRQDVRAAEQLLGVTFPVGFEAFLFELGLGSYAGVLVAFGPQFILQRVQSDRQRWAEAFYWDNPELLSQAELSHCVTFAQTIEGDEIVVHAQRPDHVYVLPRQHWKIHELPADFGLVLEWITRAGVLYEPIEDLSFVGLPDPSDTQG